MGTPIHRGYFVAIAIAVLGVAAGSCLRRVGLTPSQLETLASECKVVFDELESKGLDELDLAGPVPPSIRMVAPQRVYLVRDQDGASLDLRTSSGFQHHGLLVICRRTNPNYVPNIGNEYWRNDRRSADVYEYDE